MLVPNLGSFPLSLRWFHRRIRSDALLVAKQVDGVELGDGDEGVHGSDTLHVLADQLIEMRFLGVGVDSEDLCGSESVPLMTDDADGSICLRLHLPRHARELVVLSLLVAFEQQGFAFEGRFLAVGFFAFVQLFEKEVAHRRAVVLLGHR